MKISIEPTPQFFMAGDVMVRMWQGAATFEDGQTAPVVALVAAITFTDTAMAAVDGLVSIPPPGTEQARDWAAEVMSRRPWEDAGDENGE